MTNLALSAPQHIYLTQLGTPYRAYVGGFGSGKTYVGSLDLLTTALRHPKVVQAYHAPTYRDIKTILYPTIDEAAHSLDMTTEVKLADAEVSLYRGGGYYGTVVCRSMDRPESIVGYKVARALVDEIDVLSVAKATTAWRKIIARIRLVVDGLDQGVGVTTTPEGYKFVYETFARCPTESYSMVQASTYNNMTYLPPDYINQLIESYPEQLVRAYVRGEFVNLRSGTVYRQYDRRLNGTDAEIRPRESLHIGVDFNIGKMSAVIHVVRDGRPMALAEICGALDTQDLCRIITERYKSQGHTCYIYPDASGANRSTSSRQTDHDLIRSAGLALLVKPSNPSVSDRVTAVNAMLCNSQGERRYLINARTCPVYADALEQQVYTDTGEPDKAHDKDHPCDAAGYYIHYQWAPTRPLTRPDLIRIGGI